MKYKKILFTLLFVYCFSTNSSAVNPGDSIAVFFWTLNQPDTTARGYSGSITFNNTASSGDDTSCEGNLELREYSLWQSLFDSDGYDLSLNFSGSKPGLIGRSSNRFQNTRWLTSVNSGNDTIRFFFPVLPTDQEYVLYDHFEVAVNDTMSLEFQVIADSTIVGTFRNNRANGNSRTIIYARDAIAIRTTRGNSMRIRSIQINGDHREMVSQYLGYDLTQLSQTVTYYGLDFSGTEERNDTSITDPDLPDDTLTTMNDSTQQLTATEFKFRAAMHPFANGMRVHYSLPHSTRYGEFTVFNIEGRIVEKVTNIPKGNGSFVLRNNLSAGLYIVEARAYTTDSAKPLVQRQRVVYGR